MSITFSATGLHGTYVAHTCDEWCADYLRPGETCPGDWQEPGVNLSNANAREALIRLGLPAEDSGEVDPTDLRARIALALVVTDDSGIRPAEHREPGGPLMVDCGRRAGYWADRLTALDTVAEQAISLGVTVTWA